MLLHFTKDMWVGVVRIMTKCWVLPPIDNFNWSSIKVENVCWIRNTKYLFKKNLFLFVPVWFIDCQFLICQSSLAKSSHCRFQNLLGDIWLGKSFIWLLALWLEWLWWSWILSIIYRFCISLQRLIISLKVRTRLCIVPELFGRENPEANHCISLGLVCHANLLPDWSLLHGSSPNSRLSGVNCYDRAKLVVTHPSLSYNRRFLPLLQTISNRASNLINAGAAFNRFCLIKSVVAFVLTTASVPVCSMLRSSWRNCFNEDGNIFEMWRISGFA